MGFALWSQLSNRFHFKKLKAPNELEVVRLQTGLLAYLQAIIAFDCELVYQEVAEQKQGDYERVKRGLGSSTSRD